MTSNDSKNAGCVLILIAITFLSYLSWSVYYTYGTAGAVTATIKDKYTKRSGESDYFYIAIDQGVFINRDSTLQWKFDSADVNAELEVGKTYHIHYYGWRWPFFSWYPNITHAHQGGH